MYGLCKWSIFIEKIVGPNGLMVRENGMKLSNHILLLDGDGDDGDDAYWIKQESVLWNRLPAI